MCFLKLKDIAKIYTTDGAVAVGIRGVNLEFDIGEIVAIVGQSGSGKTSLLNVIGGIDMYEEGEMYIEDNPTSHYTNEEWEQYREEYISMIFQEYNIIDSFTALENVELVLLDEENSAKRKDKALELLERVGMKKYANHKGSQLSGGQKQRVAIARALAKDSPIILADEPTGNLDEENSRQIINLLTGVSKDKLLIIVTHNKEQVEKYISREIRIFNGAVEFERKERNDIVINKEDNIENSNREYKPSNKNRSIFRMGCDLGWNILKAKPKLSIYMFMIFVLASIGMFLFTGVIGREIKYSILEDNHFFKEMDGRIIVVKRDGTNLTKDEAAMLADTYGASRYEHCDVLIDAISEREWREFVYDPVLYMEMYNPEQLPLWLEPCSNLGRLDIGRYPDDISECVLHMPYALSDYFGREEIKIKVIKQNDIEYKVVGIKYYTDNNKMGRMLITKESYKINSYMAFIGKYLGGRIEVKLSEGQIYKSENPISLTSSFDVEEGKVYIKLKELSDVVDLVDETFECKVELARYEKNGNLEEMYLMDSEYFCSFFNSEVCYDDNISMRGTVIVANPCTLVDVYEKYVDENYYQCSLFFDSKKEIKDAINKINKTKYIAIESSAQLAYNKDMVSEYVMNGISMLLMLIILILFVFIFVSLCIKKTWGVIKNDVSIMRAVGVKTKVIKVALYIRTLLLIILTIVLLLCLAWILYRNAFANRLIMYMYPVHYVMIFIPILVISICVTKKQTKKLFYITIREALRGGE